MENTNLIYLLFILMSIITLIGIYIFNFDFLEPCNLFNIAMTTSMLFSILNVDRWDLFVGSYTCILVLIGMMSFLIGDIFCGYNCFKFYKQIKPLDKDMLLNISKFKFLILNILITVLLYFSFMEVYNLSLQVGNIDGICGMFKAVRYPLERGEISFSRWQNYRYYVVMIFAYISIYIFVSNFVLLNKVKIKYCYPVMVCFMFCILSTGRESMLHLIIYTALIWSLFVLKKNIYSNVAKRKIIKIGVFTLFLFLSLFLIIGILTGKGLADNRSSFVILSHYLGLSFPAFDKFLMSIIVEERYIANHTLIGIYSNLNSIGFELPKVKIFLPFVEFEGVNTNVYSAFMRYYWDFGIIGMGIVLFVFGTIFSYLYNYFKYVSNNLFAMLFYASFAGFIILSFHDEKFLLWIISTATIYKILLFYLCYKFIKLDFCKLNKFNL